MADLAFFIDRNALKLIMNFLRIRIRQLAPQHEINTVVRYL